MKVGYLGFEFTVANNVDSAQFFGYVRGKYHQLITYRGMDRYVFIDSDKTKKKVIGLLLTAKTHRRSLEMARTNFAVKKRTNTPGYDGADVNLFAVNPLTNKGIYQYYRSSTPPPVFKGFLHKMHGEYVKGLIEDELKKDPSLKKSALRKKYNGIFTMTMKFKKGDIAAILRDFSAISEMRVGNEAIIAKSAKYRPLKAVWTRCNASVAISVKQKIATVKKAISTFASSASSKAITIIGENLAGLPLSETINDEQNLEHFGGHGFDDFVNMLPDASYDDYVSCEAMDDILEELNNHSPYFDSPQ